MKTIYICHYSNLASFSIGNYLKSLGHIDVAYTKKENAIKQCQNYLELVKLNNPNLVDCTFKFDDNNKRFDGLNSRDEYVNIYWDQTFIDDDLESFYLKQNEKTIERRLDE